MNKHQEVLDRLKKITRFGGTCEVEVFDEDDEDIKTLQELVDKVPHYEKLESKATPKKPLFEDIGNIRHHKCPDCGKTISHEVTGTVKTFSTKHNFCSKCGQAIDWSKDENK